MKFKNGFKYYFPINEKFCLYFSDEEQDEYYSKNGDLNKKIQIRKITNQELNLFNIYQICYHNKYAISTNEKNLEYIKKVLLN
ncbi:hypothetical protein D0X99_19295 [Algoriphagus lacus]|uniref:Uncharacterized protein n=2 Tax=Algoriphagus lacus TaxID=2056311 RepID=A0A418PM12_9BACT|nr:hypothetical protein D0X99_19295 [Algoriphagus lacus]